MRKRGGHLSTRHPLLIVHRRLQLSVLIPTVETLRKMLRVWILNYKHALVSFFEHRLGDIVYHAQGEVLCLRVHDVTEHLWTLVSDHHAIRKLILHDYRRVARVLMGEPVSRVLHYGRLLLVVVRYVLRLPNR